MGTIKSWLKSELPYQRYNGMIGGVALSGHTIKVMVDGKYVKHSTAGLRAEVQTGENLGDFIGVGRVLAGGVLFGPAGAAVGALARKNPTRVYVLIHRDGELIATAETSAKHAAKARRFATLLNESATTA